MSTVHFISHPEVVIDPTVPVTLWPLAPEGVRRMRLALDRPWLGRVGSVFSSAERKATDAAHLVADRFGLSLVVVAELGGNDRSSTGYLPKIEFEAVADIFFAYPEKSVRRRGPTPQRMAGRNDGQSVRHLAIKAPVPCDGVKRSTAYAQQESPIPMVAVESTFCRNMSCRSDRQTSQEIHS